ncbi:MAG: GntR family transcriptional regulator [Planctomycetota bacterium]|nr:GntR family transcriptional regulator [Planctomycetota bacterium]
MGHIQAGRLKPGDALPSYPWLSRTVGVADKTVRQAYAELHRLGVLEIKKGKGTFVSARGGTAGEPRGIQTGVLGILPPALPIEVAEDGFFWNMMCAVQEAALEEGLDALTLSRTSDLRAPGQAERLADRARIDGLIVLAAPVEEFLARVQSLRMPVILADAHASLPVDSVAFDHAGAASELTLRLIGFGHKKIGFVRIPRGHPAAEREAGYRHAMGTAGLPVRPSWVVSVDVDLGETGASAIDTLLDEGVSALVAFNGSLALTAAECAARRKLRVPGDLSIAATVADGPWHLPGGLALSCEAFRPAELGARAVQRLLERIHGKQPEARRETVAAQRVEGASIAPPASPA